MIIKLLALFTAVFIEKVRSEYDCFNKTIDEDNDKTIHVSFKKETMIELELELSSTPNAVEHIDMQSSALHIVLRLKFTCGAGDSSNSSTLRITSLKHNDTTGRSETVGNIDTETINYSSDSRRIKLNILITEDGFDFKLDVVGDNLTLPRSWSRDHSDSILYETTEVMFLGTFSYMVIRICNLPDACTGVCLTCPGGSYLQPRTAGQVNQNYWNATYSCKECGHGNYSDANNVAACSPCQPGSYAKENAATSCIMCSAGTYSADPGGISCRDCSLGTYSSSPGAGYCTDCPPGWVTNSETRAESCTECDIGSYSPGSATHCQTCGNNTVTPSPGATECLSCDHDARNATHCTCVAGTRRVTEATCASCSEGTYTPRADMTKCVDCSGDVLANNTCRCPDGEKLERDVCVSSTCKPGTRIEDDGSCVSCSPGTFSSEANSLTCTPCSEGSYQDNGGSDMCILCRPGTSQHHKGASSCSLCQRSTYQPAWGQIACLYCHGTISNNTCDNDVFECRDISESYANVGILTWDAASTGDVITVSCPHGGSATRTCYKNAWQQPDLADCNSVITAKIVELIANLTDKDGAAVTSAISTLISEDIERFAPKDLAMVTELLEGTDVTGSQVAEQMLGSVVQLVGYNDNLEHVVASTTKDRVVSLIDRGVSYLVDNGRVDDIDKYSTSDISINISKNGDAFKQPNRNQKVSISQLSTFSTLIYHNSKLFEVDKDWDKFSSDILSVSLHGGEKEQDFQVDVRMELTLTGTAECRWYDTDRRVWSTAGCYVMSRSGGSLNCQCDHLTSFAVFTSLSEVPESHRNAQSLLTTLLFILSIVTCILTLGVYLPIRSLRNKVIIRVEMMEVTALILANVTFLVVSRVQHQSRVCAGLVFALQYFYLATIAWSFVAAWTFYRQIVNAIHTYGKTYQHTFLLSFLLCWTLPLIFPSFAVIYSQKHGVPYIADINGEFGCWMAETWKTYTFIVPILVVVAINTILGLRVIFVMLRANSKKVDAWETHKRHIKSIISLLTIFGTSFLLSLFTYGPHAIVFQYLFICFTCSQGLFIFVLFVPLRPEVHSEWKNFLTRTSSNRISSPKTSRTESSTVFSRQLFRRMSSTLMPARRDTDESLKTSTPKNGTIEE